MFLILFFIIVFGLGLGLKILALFNIPGTLLMKSVFRALNLHCNGLCSEK